MAYGRHTRFITRIQRKSNLQKEEDTKRADILIEELKQRLQREKVTPEKQKLAADIFSSIRSWITMRNKTLLL